MGKIMMIYFTAICWVLLMAGSMAGLIETHHHLVHEPIVTKVGTVIQTLPSAVSHQSLTQVHGETIVEQPILAPAVKTTSFHTSSGGAEIPLLHTSSLSAPLVHAYHHPTVLTVHH